MGSRHWPAKRMGTKSSNRTTKERTTAGMVAAAATPSNKARTRASEMAATSFGSYTWQAGQTSQFIFFEGGSAHHRTFRQGGTQTVARRNPSHQHCDLSRSLLGYSTVRCHLWSITLLFSRWIITLLRPRAGR